MRPAPLAVVATALLLASPAVRGLSDRPAGIDLLPSLLELTVRPGDRIERTVTLTNPGEEALSVSVQAADWTMHETGKVRFDEAGSLPNSCARWIGVSPSNFLVPARGQTQVRVSVASPPGFSGTRWAVVFFSLAETAGLIEGRLVTFAPRVGLTVYVTAAGTEKESLHFSKASASAGSDRVVRLRAVFENSGNTAERVRLNWQIRAADGSVVKTLVTNVVCLPGVRREETTAVDGLAPGNYRVTAMARWGPRKWQAIDCDLVITQ